MKSILITLSAIQKPPIEMRSLYTTKCCFLQQVKEDLQTREKRFLREEANNKLQLENLKIQIQNEQQY